VGLYFFFLILLLFFFTHFPRRRPNLFFGSVMAVCAGPALVVHVSAIVKSVEARNTLLRSFFAVVGQVELSLNSMSCRLLYKQQLPSRRRE
jgi:hypothetical protein